MVNNSIGLGTSEFKKIRVQNYYYIDKTMYIKDIIDNKSEVILVTIWENIKYEYAKILFRL